MKHNSYQRLIAVSVFSAAVLFLNGCGKKKEGQHAPFGGGMQVQVVAFKAKRQPIEEKISLVGSIAANESVEIKSEIDGTVEEINFQEGQFVKQGTILLRIDEKKLRAAVAQAEANLKLAETTAQRYQSLVASKAVSQQEFDETTATLETNRASAELTREQLKDAVIEAPFDGIMGERRVSVGQYIAQGTSLSFLVSQNPIKAAFNVPERFLSRIKQGQAINIRVDAYPNEMFNGEVYFIDPRIDENTRTTLVKALLPNDDGKLRPGMFANLNLILFVRQEAIVIPEPALIVNGDNVSIFVVDENNAAHERQVKAGIRMEGLAEITEGLKEGEVAVTEGHQKLRDGAQVNPRFEEPEK